MANWIEVGAADMLPDGAMEEIQVGERTVLLARVDGTYYACILDFIGIKVTGSFTYQIWGILS